MFQKLRRGNCYDNYTAEANNDCRNVLFIINMYTVLMCFVSAPFSIILNLK